MPKPFTPHYDDTLFIDEGIFHRYDTVTVKPKSAQQVTERDYAWEVVKRMHEWVWREEEITEQEEEDRVQMLKAQWDDAIEKKNQNWMDKTFTPEDWESLTK